MKDSTKNAVRKTAFVIAVAVAAIIVASLPMTFPFFATLIQVIGIVAWGISGWFLVIGTIDMIVRGRRSWFIRIAKWIGRKLTGNPAHA